MRYTKQDILNLIEEEDVEYLKQEQMKKAISEMKTDIMLVSDGSDIVFDAGW